MTKPSRRTIKPKWLLNFLHEEEIELKTAADAIGIHSDSLMDDQGRMPLDAYLQLLEWTAKKLDRPHLGLELASVSGVDDFGMLGFLATSAETLSEAARVFERYQRILMQGENLQFIEHAEAVELRFSVTTGYTDCTAQDVEFTLAMMSSMVQFTTDITWKPIKTGFCHGKIDPVTSYDDPFGSNVLFDQAHNSLWIDYEVWSARTQSANSALLDILKIQANQLLSELEKSGDLLEHVKFLISANLGSESFSVEVLAEHLNMTSRTLHRRLEEHHTSFKQLRLEHMMLAARKALQDSNDSITIIAQQLGYSDSSAFARVFKRLQGLSPLKFRKSKKIF